MFHNDVVLELFGSQSSNRRGGRDGRRRERFLAGRIFSLFAATTHKEILFEFSVSNKRKHVRRIQYEYGIRVAAGSIIFADAAT